MGHYEKARFRKYRIRKLIISVKEFVGNYTKNSYDYVEANLEPSRTKKYYRTSGLLQNKFDFKSDDFVLNLQNLLLFQFVFRQT